MNSSYKPRVFYFKYMFDFLAHLSRIMEVGTLSIDMWPVIFGMLSFGFCIILETVSLIFFLSTS